MLKKVVVVFFHIHINNQKAILTAESDIGKMLNISIEYPNPALVYFYVNITFT